MFIKKQVDILLQDNKAKLSKPLVFYVNDTLRLYFNFKSLEYVFSGTVRRGVVQDLNAFKGFISIETPIGTDIKRSLVVDDDGLYLELDREITGLAGNYLLQIFLTTEANGQVAIPPFPLTVENTINEEMDGLPLKEVSLMINDLGECFLGSKNEIIIFK